MWICVDGMFPVIWGSKSVMILHVEAFYSKSFAYILANEFDLSDA